MIDPKDQPRRRDVPERDTDRDVSPRKRDTDRDVSPRKRDTDRDETPPSETETFSAAVSENETPARQTGLLRDIVSGLAILGGLAGTVLCLAHLTPWATGLVVSLLAACLGLVGAVHRDTGETPPVEHLIEIRHTEEDPGR